MLTTYVGKELGGVGGPMAFQEVRTREEPVGAEQVTSSGIEKTSSSFQMTKWKYLCKEYKKKQKMGRGDGSLPF